ncbi:hypothetical protein BASA81_002074 [Batrachochytrium salamandrivorans]|nr:hypothetical protein BASA81_002074 [Batrachochytrium salamandrivorans]
MRPTKAPSYANRLSECEDKGVVGLKEIRDRARQRDINLNKLCKLVRDSKSVIVLTGAGISTSAGIADFRGPTGVWTKERLAEKKGKKAKLQQQADEEDNSFELAVPTKTHLVLTKLCNNNVVRGVISQNVDGLHMRSLLPRNRLVELHGNVFLERCNLCKHEVFHKTDVGGVGCKPTGNVCPQCPKGKLHDTVLDWDTPIDQEYLDLAEEWMRGADLVICLGTSLRIVPAANLPLLMDQAGKLAIVNLQPTPHDAKADLLLRCEVDLAMDRLEREFGGV